MPELHDLLERRASGYGPPPDLFERVLDRRRRRDRSRRVGATLVAVGVLAVVIAAFARFLPDRGLPANDPYRPFVGTWTSTDPDGSVSTLTVGASGGEAVEITVRDDSTSLCSGDASTMTGTGRIERTGELVVASPVLTCADGTVPGAPGSPPEEPRDLIFIRDREADTLADSLGAVWAREGEETVDRASDDRLGWPDTGSNPAGVYSWDGSTCSSDFCSIGFIHNGYAPKDRRGDVEISIRALPSSYVIDDDATGVILAGHYATHRRIGPLGEEWIIHIEGTRVAIGLSAAPDTSQTDLADAHAIVESMRTERQDTDLGFRLVFRVPTDDWDSG